MDAAAKAGRGQNPLGRQMIDAMTAKSYWPVPGR